MPSRHMRSSSPALPRLGTIAQAAPLTITPRSFNRNPCGSPCRHGRCRSRSPGPPSSPPRGWCRSGSISRCPSPRPDRRNATRRRNGRRADLRSVSPARSLPSARVPQAAHSAVSVDRMSIARPSPSGRTSDVLAAASLCRKPRPHSQLCQTRWRYSIARWPNGRWRHSSSSISRASEMSSRNMRSSSAAVSLPSTTASTSSLKMTLR